VLKTAHHHHDHESDFILEQANFVTNFQFETRFSLSLLSPRKTLKPPCEKYWKNTNYFADIKGKTAFKNRKM
jgi:hypothetical protein